MLRSTRRDSNLQGKSRLLRALTHSGCITNSVLFVSLLTAFSWLPQNIGWKCRDLFAKDNSLTSSKVLHRKTATSLLLHYRSMMQIKSQFSCSHFSSRLNYSNEMFVYRLSLWLEKERAVTWETTLFADDYMVRSVWLNPSSQYLREKSPTDRVSSWLCLKFLGNKRNRRVDTKYYSALIFRYWLLFWIPWFWDVKMQYTV